MSASTSMTAWVEASPPSGASPVSRMAALQLYLSSVLLDVGHKLLKRRHRDRAQVVTDYDQGEWTDTLRDRRWESVSTLEQYVIPASSRRLKATINGRLVDVSQQDYMAYRTRALVSILETFGLGADRLVEIGCGAGRNLFAAAYAGPWRELHGLELSKVGLQVVEAVAERLGLQERVRASPIDLLDPRSEGFEHLRGEVAFTHYCLEQLPSHTEQVLRHIGASGVRRVVHIEPTPELMSWTRLRDLATISYNWRQHYLHDLVAVCRRLQGQGLIRIVWVQRLGFAPTLRNTPTLVVWEPAGPAR
jgi:hypothetical protein